MSALTKVFVVLLVVLSIVLTSATVVFVNRVDNAKTALDNTTAQKNAAEAKAAAASSELARMQADAQQLAEQNRSQLNAANNSALAAQQQLADRDARIAQLQTQLATQSQDLARLTEALKSSQGTTAQLQQVVSTMRADADKNLQQIAQLNAAVSDLTNRLEVTERERRNFQEQYTEAQNQIQKMSGAMKSQGITMPSGNGNAAANASAPPISGTIRGVKDIAGIPYATISVGASEGVQKGMEFKIIDPQSGDFYGVLTVDSVEQQEATGTLRGPKINQVQPGLQVRTQL